MSDTVILKREDIVPYVAGFIGAAPIEVPESYKITRIDCPCGIKSLDDYIRCSARNSPTAVCKAAVHWVPPS